MMKPADAERLTGYKVGGISPFGQKRKVPTAIEAGALEHDRVFINGGQRGLQVCLAPRAAQQALDALIAPLVADTR
jgi:Cys-tRNA(Pro)/Cys-tRNA(Cys) deacylase